MAVVRRRQQEENGARSLQSGRARRIPSRGDHYAERLRAAPSTAVTRGSETPGATRDPNLGTVVSSPYTVGTSVKAEEPPYSRAASVSSRASRGTIRIRSFLASLLWPRGALPHAQTTQKPHHRARPGDRGLKQ